MEMVVVVVAVVAVVAVVLVLVVVLGAARACAARVLAMAAHRVCGGGRGWMRWVAHSSAAARVVCRARAPVGSACWWWGWAGTR